MRRINRSRTVIAGVALTALVAGGTGIIAASAGAAPAGGATGAAGQEQDGSQEPSYTGSIQAPEGSGGEEAENAALSGLAVITPEEAATAAGSAVAGTVGTAALENENGFVVYQVDVTAADGSVVEVKVDAGTGAVLAQEADNDASEGAEGAEGTGG